MAKAQKNKVKNTKKPEFKKLTEKQIAALTKSQKRRYKHQLRVIREEEIRKKDLESLPEGKLKRFFARLAPKRVWHFLKSWRGQKRILRVIAACFLLFVIFIGFLFVYYKQQIRDIELSNIAISETVNTYLDRNGVVLWEDTGNDNYRLVVDGSEISTYMRQATVAIEDRNFYNHPGVDIGALIRAVISTVSGRGVQGGSTLTQQLIKQVYFSDEAASANRGGITRKIKELILAIELEKMYDKEQIITMYLNQSPYGGRRNGVESAAQTYFGKSAADLNLAESALLASIPNNPAVLNPYNSYGNDALIARQHKVLDVMAELGYVTKEEAEAAKEINILDQILPESSQYTGILAPHFVLEVRDQLEEKYGIATMRQGGYTIVTTLDYRAQKIAEDAIATGQKYMYKNKSDNLALVSVDVETSQVIAMVGSVDFYNVEYGEMNATVDSLIEPGSSIKPILDYTPLFMQREGQNFGPGSILRDENIDRLYCAGYVGSCSMRNITGSFYGNIPIRQSLANSLNIAAVKALYINGVENSLEIAHKLGDKTYCEGRSDYGLSIAIGSGCNVRLVEHANAYASLARGGSYKDLAYVLEVKDSKGNVIESWEDTPAERVVDEQVAYMVTDILADQKARWWYNNEGYVISGVWTGTKTGTTTTASSSVAKDSLMESFSTALSTIVWNGNHDGSGLANNSHDPVRFTVNEFMERVHKEVYGPDGKWQSGDKPVKPAGIKTLSVNGGKADIWPSWYDEKNNGSEKVTLVFNKLNHLLATECTPDSLKISIEATKTIDPFSKQEIWNVPEPYNREEKDNCALNDYTEPRVSISIVGSSLRISASGYGTLSYSVSVDGQTVETGSTSTTTFMSNYSVTGDEETIKVTISDAYGGSASDSI